MRTIHRRAGRIAGAVVLVAALILAGPSPARAATSSGGRTVIDRVAAVIEGDIITLRELEEKASQYLGQLPAEGAERETRRNEILQKVLDIEIGERIVGKELEANRDRLGVTDADVDRAIEQVMQSNNLTRERLQAALYAQGMTWSEYRKTLREQIERARLIQFKVQGRVQIGEQEVKRRCLERQSSGSGGEQVCAAHILLRIPAGASDNDMEMIRARAGQLQAELSAGADFDAYALAHSEDKTAPDGDIGCFEKGDMVEAFEQAAFATPVGKVSPVIRTEFGFHVIKVLERKAAPSPCDDEESLVPFRNELYQERMEQQMNVWIDELRKNAFVEVRL